MWNLIDQFSNLNLQKKLKFINDSRATATLETETEFSRDARAIRERVLKQVEEALKGKGARVLGVRSCIKGSMPMWITRLASEGNTQFQVKEPLLILELQKDFIISLIFARTSRRLVTTVVTEMHDRVDYESRWLSEKARKSKLAMGSDDRDEDAAEQSDEDDEDALPLACFICGEAFVDPVVTKVQALLL